MKLPWFKFFPSTWHSDQDLSKCKPETRGVWIDLICAMHKNDQSGEISGTISQLAQISRCTPSQFSKAIADLSATKTATVMHRNDTVTVINRRMQQEFKAKVSAAIRAKRHRQKQKSNTNSKPEKLDVRSKMLEDKIIQNTKQHGLLESDEQAFLNNQIQNEQFCMTKGITITQLIELKKEFVGDLKLKGEPVRDLQRHFVNWYNVLLQKGVIKQPTEGKKTKEQIYQEKLRAAL